MSILAVLLDLLFGDPPNRYHPTAWMGNLIGWLVRFRPRGGRLAELGFGIFILLEGLTLTTVAGVALAFLANRLPGWAGILLTAFALKSSLSLRGLDRAAGQVQAALAAGDLPEARRRLSWHLVSRDTSQLDDSGVCAAAIESVAENASDGVVAPLFFFALGGLPAAFAYRFINTADSMLGYRDAEHEWLGKAPARLDDLLNFIPARLAGICLLLAAPFCGADAMGGWRILWRDAKRTASPNAGIPMSAMAGALGVELEKTGHYRLGEGLRAPTIADLGRARRIMFMAVILAALAFSLLAFLYKPPLSVL